MEAMGWAVIKDGEIKIKTVSDTRRAAQINWLVAERGLMIYSHYSDDRIDRMWCENRNGAVIDMVTIAPALPATERNTGDDR